MTDHKWQPGQQAVINRREVVTVDRVTEKGRAVIGTRHFRPDGRQIGGNGGQLLPWTQELQDDVDAAAHASKVQRRLHDAIVRLNRQYTAWFDSHFTPRTATVEEIAKAEELIAAIGRILGDQT